MSNTAILVIHGIGQQQPYQTLDQFGAGLVTALNAERPGTTWEIKHEIVANTAGLARPKEANAASVGVSTDSKLQLTPPVDEDAPPPVLERIDVHEVCW